MGNYLWAHPKLRSAEGLVGEASAAGEATVEAKVDVLVRPGRAMFFSGFWGLYGREIEGLGYRFRVFGVLLSGLRVVKI